MWRCSTLRRAPSSRPSPCPARHRSTVSGRHPPEPTAGRSPARAVVQDRPMRLPVLPPVSPMLAKSVKDIPAGDLSYEPKWDGFRSIVFRDGDEVEIGSRNERPMTRYFPEVVEAI